MRHTNWEVVDNLYTIEHLEKHLDSERVQRYNEKDIMVVLQGTNNVRKGQEAIEKVSRYLEALDKLTKMTQGRMSIVMIGLPPLGKKYDGSIQTERKVFNKFIQNSNYMYLDTEAMLSELDETERLSQDDLHLTPKAAEIIAHQINVMTRNYQKREIEAPEEIEGLSDYLNIGMKVQKDSIRHLVGKQGSMINSIEHENKVKLSIEGSNNDPYKNLRISGEKTRVQRAAEMARDVINKRKAMTPCTFYQQGYCKKGESCKFSHDEAGAQGIDNNQGRARSRERYSSERRNERYENTQKRYTETESRNENRQYSRIDRNEMDRGRYTGRSYDSRTDRSETDRRRYRDRSELRNEWRNPDYERYDRRTRDHTDPDRYTEHNTDRNKGWRNERRDRNQ